MKPDILRRLYGTVRFVATNEELTQAIQRYAIYLGQKATMDLHAQWKDAEQALAKLVSIETMKSHPHRFIGGRSMDDFLNLNEPPPEPYQLLMNELSEEGCAASSRLREIFDNLPPASHLKDDRERQARLILQSQLLQAQTKHQAAIADDLRPLRQPGKSGVWIIAPVHPTGQERVQQEQNIPTPVQDISDDVAKAGALFFVKTRDRYANFQMNLLSTRHLLLEPVIRTLNQRGQERKSRSCKISDGGRLPDTGTRDLLRVALATGTDTRALAERLVTEGLDLNPKGSRASRILREAKRLNTRLKAAQKALVPGFPSPRNH